MDIFALRESLNDCEAVLRYYEGLFVKLRRELDQAYTEIEDLKISLKQAEVGNPSEGSASPVSEPETGSLTTDDAF